MHLDQRIAAIKRVEGALEPLQDEGYEARRIIYDEDMDHPFLITIYLTYSPPADLKRLVL